MNAILTLPQPLVGLPPEPAVRLTVDQYHRMIAAGILNDESGVELLEGWMIPTMPRNPTHDFSLGAIEDAIRACLPTGWFLRGQCAVTTDDSEPEPDVVVVRGTRRQYEGHHPGPADIALVVEVSDTTLHRDRTLKARIYARAAVPVYWILNLQDRTVEVYTDPSGPADEPAYRQRRDFTADAALPIVVGGQELGTVPVGDILPAIGGHRS